MRVLVELFDKELVENVLAACVFEPEIVVFLCDTGDTTFFKESAIYRLLRRRGLRTQPRFYYFDTTDPAGIRRVLAAVVRDYPGCVFDYTGGADLVLLMAGACAAELDLPGFYLDIRRRRFVDVRGCARLAPRFAMPAFTVDDVFALSGATVQGHGHFHLGARLDEAFEDQALAVFEIVRQSPRAWAQFTAWLQAFCGGAPANAARVEGARVQKGGLRVDENLLRRLRAAGMLAGCEVDGARMTLTFPSPLHRKSLMIEGVWLELYCYVTARRSGSFDDVRTSIVVDWDGVENAGGTKNEVDVVLVRGVVPVFVSCKMSAPSPLALSEIRLLSAKFGGGLARTVVLTAAGLGGRHSAIAARAAELGVTLLDGAVLQRGDLPALLWQLAGEAPPPPRPAPAGRPALSDIPW